MRGGKRIRSLTALTLASCLVAGAVLGPQLTRQSIRPLGDVRHDILMIEREFECISIRTEPGPFRTTPITAERRGHASGARSKTTGDGDRV